MLKTMTDRDRQTYREITVTNHLIVKLHTRRRIRFYTNVPLKKYPHTQWPTQKFIFWVESGDIDQSPSSFLPLFFRRITQPLKSNL